MGHYTPPFSSVAGSDTGLLGRISVMILVAQSPNAMKDDAREAAGGLCRTQAKALSQPNSGRLIACISVESGGGVP